jgi:predicted P-loop ATPase
MSDPYKISDPQSDRILAEMDYQNRFYRAGSYNSNMLQKLERDAERTVEEALANAGLNRQQIPARHEKAFKVWLELKDLGKAERERQNRSAEFETYAMVVALASSCGNRLRLNTMTGQIEFISQTYKETVIIEDKQHLNIIAEGDWRCNKLPTSDAILEYATAYKYSPVVEYLLGLQEIDENSADQILEKLCSECLEQSEPLKKQMVIKTLIGAVARAFNPGTQMQTVLTLQGKQGEGKSEFFKALFGEKFFGPLNSQGDTRDWSMSLSQVWAAELGELEAFTTKHSNGILKAFVSEGQDLYRAPYDRKSKKHPRHSILVATVNDRSPLIDTTGNRRWWMLEAPDKFDLNWVKINREKIWAAALLKYNAGETHWFSGTDEQAAMANADIYRAVDPWEELLGEFLECLKNPEIQPSQENVRQMLLRSSHIITRDTTRKNTTSLATNELLEILGITEDKRTRSLTLRLGDVMRLVGYEMRQQRVGKKGTIRIWEPVPN